MGKTMQQVYEEAGRRFPLKVRRLDHEWAYGRGDVAELVSVEPGGRDFNGDPSRVWVDHTGWRHMISEHELVFELVSSAPAGGPCRCSIPDLMATGCTCGAIVPYAQRSKG
jgi:hypothetical protein